MARIRRYLDIDVLHAAKRRMRDIYQLHDHVVVNFSGGKDSLVVLGLAKEAAEAAGKLPVNAMFYDEELIPDQVLETVDYYRQQPWVNLKWMVCPLESNKFIMGRSYRYIQWDPNRKWLREPPTWAIRPTAEELPQGTTSQYEVSQIAAKRFWPGRVAFSLGLRASESLLRLRACLAVRSRAWLVGPEAGKGRISTARPIYDWAENDVLKYIMETGMVYSALYDAQHLAGGALRVSTPLHSEASKTFARWRTLAPVFYQQIVNLFPEMTVQERYWSEFDQSKLLDTYSADGWDGVERYIQDTFDDPSQRMLAFKRLTHIKDRARLHPEQFPPRAALGYFIGGGIKRDWSGVATRYVPHTGSR